MWLVKHERITCLQLLDSPQQGICSAAESIHTMRAAQGVATGEVTFTIESPPERGETVPRSSAIAMAVTLEIIPTPARWAARMRRMHARMRRVHARLHPPAPASLLPCFLHALICLHTPQSIHCNQAA